MSIELFPLLYWGKMGFMDGFQDWLSQELQNRRLSQRELARQSGISQALISQTLSGDVSPSADFA